MVHIVTNNSNDVTSILVKFDNGSVGAHIELDLLMLYLLTSTKLCSLPKESVDLKSSVC